MDNNYNLPNTDETVNNNQYNYPPAYNMPQQPIQQDKVSVGFCILAWLVPLFGLIYYLSKKSEKPKGAKAIGICSLVSFVINMIITIASFAFTGSMFNKTLDTVDKFADSSIVEDYQNNEWSDNLGDVNNAVDNSSFSYNENENIKEFTFNYGETKIELPIKLSEFMEITGYRAVTNGDAVIGNDSIYTNYEQVELKKDEHKYINVGVVNTDETGVKPVKDCYVYEIWVSWGLSEENFTDTLNTFTDKKLCIVNNKMTDNDVISMLGQPDNTEPVYFDKYSKTPCGNKYTYDSQNKDVSLIVKTYNNEYIDHIALKYNDLDNYTK